MKAIVLAGYITTSTNTSHSKLNLCIIIGDLHFEMSKPLKNIHNLLQEV